MQSSKKFIALIFMLTSGSTFCIKESRRKTQESKVDIEHVEHKDSDSLRVTADVNSPRKSQSQESDPFKLERTISGSLHDVSLEDVQKPEPTKPQKPRSCAQLFLSCFVCCKKNNQIDAQQDAQNVVSSK